MLPNVEYGKAGYNVQWDYCDAARKDWIRGYMGGPTKPQAMLFLNSFGDSRADIIQLAEDNPHTGVMYRRYYGDNVQERLSVQTFREHHAPFRGTRAWVLCNNEPNFAASVRYHEQIIDACIQDGIRVVVGSYSVGVPEVRPNFGQLPLAEGMIRRASAYPDRVRIGIHEYGPPNLAVDFSRDNPNPSAWPVTIPQSTELHLFGRYRVWAEYARSLNIPVPNFFIDEWGFDYIDAVKALFPKPLGPLMANRALWESWGFTNWEHYAAAQLQRIYTSIVRQDTYVKGFALFTLHSTPGIWHDHNYGRAPALIEHLAKGFTPMPETTQTTPVGVPFQPGRKQLRKAPQNFINIRETPNGADKGDLYNGEIVTVLPITPETVKTAGVWKWQLIEWNGVRYWIALTGAFELVPVQSKAEFIAKSRALLDEYEAMPD